MGRHGGGSRSGGRRSSSSSSNKGGSAQKVSVKPFKGCYNRSYYHRGVCHSYYTTEKDFGTNKSRIRSQLFNIIIITIIILPFILNVASTVIRFGGKVNGDSSRIVIQDTIDLLTPEEEQRTLDLFNKVY